MISVIIPTYNRSIFLKEAIHSVLNQDYFKGESSDEFELLVIDDGSTDDTSECIKSFRNTILYHFQENKGVSAARNLGLKLARGEYIAFLDSDDLWENNKISIQMSYMTTHPRAMACYTEETWIRQGVFVNPKRRHQKYSGRIFDKVLPLCLLSLSSALFRKESFNVLGNFDEDLPACEDYDFGIRVAQKYPIHLISKPLIVKRGGHPDQLSRKYWGMDRFRIKALEKSLLLDLTPDQRELVRKEIIKKCQVLVKGFQKRNKYSDVQMYSKLIDKYRLEKGD